MHYIVCLACAAVIRFGAHREFIRDFWSNDLFHYHPHTAMQLDNPTKDSTEYASQQVKLLNKYYSDLIW